MTPLEHYEAAQEWLANGDMKDVSADQAVACAAMAQAHMKAAELGLCTSLGV